MQLDDASGCSELLLKLIRTDQYHTLVAFQLSFDLEVNAKQEFLQKVLQRIPVPVVSVVATTPVSTGNDSPQAIDALMSDVQVDSHQNEFTKVRSILTGELSIKLNLQFLSRNNHADLLYLKKSKLLESKSSIFHSAISFSNGFMNAGTTSDEFLRSNLQWLALASNWSKFSATAALGVIHKVT